MSKTIQFTFENGEVWEIDLHEVADHRAKYYASRDKDTTYQEEYDYVMNDLHEGIDWFFNNTNPEDFEGKFRKVKDAPKHDINWMIRNIVKETRLKDSNR